MTDIRLLPDFVANQIAAGEVVQRPASVVKELLENAVDAGATEISLVLVKSGKEHISVTDNGSGIAPNQISLAFKRHATSKISRAEDLFSLATKGFRGEALASIAAISQVLCNSRLVNSETAYQYRNHGGEEFELKEVVAPYGTTINVKHLFYNIPARRNFLKSDAVELRHCIDEFHRIAIVHTEIHWKMYSDDQLLFNLPPINLLQRLGHIFGSKFPQRLVPVSEETPDVAISGYLLRPEFAKKSRQEQFFFINDRFVKSPYLHKSVTQAFEGLIPSDMQPGYFLFLRVDPAKIDVNIHPTKTEIKLSDEFEIFSILKAAVRHSLGQFKVSSSIDFDLNPSYELNYETARITDSYKLPRVSVDRSFNPFGNESTRPLFDQENAIIIDQDPIQHSLDSDFSNQGLLLTSDKSPLQLDHKFILLAKGNELIAIDQFRAHQRVLYERFLRAMTVDTSHSQQWLFSEQIELNAQELLQFRLIEDQLIDLGFHIEAQENSIILKGGPEFFEQRQSVEVFKELLNQSYEHDTPENLSIADLTSKILSRNLATRGGVKLTVDQMLKLLTDLDACKESQVSPDGKRIFIVLNSTEIALKFN